MKPGDKVRWRKSVKVGHKVGQLEVYESMPFEGINTIRTVESNGNITLEKNPFYYNPKMLVVVK